MKKTTIMFTALLLSVGATAVVAANDSDSKGVNQTSFNDSGENIVLQSTVQNNGETTTQKKDGLITKEEAKKAALSVLDGDIKEVERDKEDGRLIYEVEVLFEGEEYDFDIDTYTAEVIEIDDDLLKTPVANEMKITVEEAKEIANDLVPNSKIDDIELKKEKGIYVYDIELELNDEDGDLYLDANTGEVIKLDGDIMKEMERMTTKSKSGNESHNGKTNESTSYISKEEATKIALDYLGEGTLDEVERKIKSGNVLYEVEIEIHDDDVEVYVDAVTGDVLYVDWD
ncbi:PepSY domain-containing protein [Alkalihalobacillus sp. 1P02AB]|uniref:PepSY domain-containing protein n=1 Tax=Alkalihalobacillus sp. 1P02AB TaxID=3132260 RepID=UPI0039A5C8E7